jgi:ATP-dependent DNA ligase
MLASMLAKPPVKNAILDGELVCLGRRKSQDACFYAFDLLWLDCQDLRGLTFLEWKSRLRS